jgi:DNA-binding CsgD family transcriptional regulator
MELIIMIETTTTKILQTNKDLKSSFAGLRNVPGFVIAKDLKSKYSIISNDYAQLLGWKNSEQCEDLCDFDIPSAAVEAAEMFVDLDQKVVKNESEVLSLYICQYSLGWKTLLSSKKPIHDAEDQLTGIFGHVMDVSHTNILQWSLPLNIFDNKKFNDSDNKKPKIYILNKEQTPLPLSRRQQTCLFLLIRGKSAKEIAKILDISYRTVEVHLALIKQKLDCNSRSQLIEIAISSGFLNYIPEDILQKNPLF